MNFKTIQMPKDFVCLTIQWFLSKMVYLEVGAIPLEHLANLVLLLFWWRHRCWMEDPRPYFLLSLNHPQTPWWTQQWIQRVKTMEVTHPLMDSTVSPKGENNRSDAPSNSLMDSTVSPKGQNNESDTPPNSLMNSIVSPKGENTGRIRSWGTLFSL